MASHSKANSGDIVSFPSILIYFTSYFVIERIIKKTFQHFNPEFYNRLRLEGKDAQYFAFVMGWLITAFSSPFCYKAFLDSNESSDSTGNQHITMAGEICMASKGVMWASELSRLDHSVGYITHHLSSITYLVYHIQVRLPLSIIYLFYASCATELLSDLACLTTLHGLKQATSPLAYRIQTGNALLLAVLRIPPMIYAASFLPLYPINSITFWINAASLFIYARFIVKALISESKRLEIFTIAHTKPTFVRVAKTFDISLYGMFFGMASFTTAVLTATVYAQSFPRTLTPKQFAGLNIQLLLIGFMAFIGARIPSILSTHGISGIVSTRIFAPHDLWIQGGISAAALGNLLSPLTQKFHLFLSLAMALPIGEAIGRLGCYFAGCCGAPASSTRRIPLQLQSAILNAIAGICCFAALRFAGSSLEKTAAISLAANAAIRILLRVNSFAIAQLIVALSLLTTNKSMNIPAAIAIASNSPNAFQNNQTSPYFGFPPHNDPTMATEINTLKSPWTAALALSAIAAGTFVQGCTVDLATFSPRQGCGAGGGAVMGLGWGCSGGGSAVMGLKQGCAVLAADGMEVSTEKFVAGCAASGG